MTYTECSMYNEYKVIKIDDTYYLLLDDEQIAIPLNKEIESYLEAF